MTKHMCSSLIEIEIVKEELKAFEIKKISKGTMTSGEPFLTLYVSLNAHKFIIQIDATHYYILDSECQRILKTRSWKKFKEKINDIERIASFL